jgi:hypothetical protein
MKRLICLVSALLLLAGCGAHVVPKPTATAVLDPATNALSWTSRGLALSVRLADLEVARTQMIDRIASFAVTIDNRTERDLPVALSAFVLLDEQGNQIRPVTPQELLRIVSRDSFYLIPYPYFGYYYLEDRAKLQAFNASSSPLPYFPETHPQAILMEALPEGPVLPGARISGLVYFPVDLETKKQVEFRAYLAGAETTAPAEFAFPFSVEKK